jgi:hypothetical protein
MRQREKPFAQLYHDALRDKTLSAEARFIAVLFATYAGRDGLAYPSTRCLMELTHWGERKVKAARAELVRVRWLGKEFSRSPRGFRARTAIASRARCEISGELKATSAESSQPEATVIGSGP